MIDGTADRRFDGVRQAFESCFADGLEHGAAVAVMVDGKLVVDLWGGHADAAKTKPWQRDTLVNLWSATKGITALAIAMLVERGRLDYAAPLAKVWPAFAARGKENITLDQVLSHQAGLHGLDVEMSDADFYAWHPFVEALAAMAPLWEPGSRCVYHPVTYGHLAGEALRRADGRSVGRFIAEEIAGPLDLSFFVGLPAAEERRVAEMRAEPSASAWVSEGLAGPYHHCFRNPTITPLKPNERAWRAAELPAVNGQGDARSLATMYGLLARGGELARRRLISQEGIARATAERFRGQDPSLGVNTAYGAGFRIDDPTYGPSSAGPDATAGHFGHSGWGGTIAFADPAARLGFAFVTARMQDFDTGIDPRRQRLTDAVYAAL